MSLAGNHFRYWGKASAERNQQAAPYHLLPYHCLDVAAVGRLLLDGNRALSARLAGALAMDEGELRQFLVFSLALHDIGKFARSFQGLAHIDGCDLVPHDGAKPYQRRHDALAVMLWEDCLKNRMGIPWPDDPDAEDDTDLALRLWLGSFFGHHGKPAADSTAPIEADFENEDLEAALAFASEVGVFLEPCWPLEYLQNEDWRTERLAPMTWQLAGVAVLADWLGSNADFFPYCATPMPLARYWKDHALPGAQRALAETGLADTPVATAFPGFADSFGLPPTPLQSWAETVTLASGPQLFVLEDITGAGKTEAALTLAHRLLAEGHGNGVYFGLPTMATSNAMYRRLGGHYRRFYPEGSHPSLVLAHGARHLDAAFEASVVPEANRDLSYSRDEDSAGAACRAWFADSRKKALLAEVGVGTVDQALLGVLPCKHQSLRLLGLADKVLVVDEVHAYDPYTARLLQTLLEDHARQGGSAILLSATIPHGLRQALVDAWDRGRGGTEHELAGTDFPLATHIHDGGREEKKVEARPASRRDLPVDFLHDPEDALAAVVAAAEQGQCACWIRNTVDDAVEAYRLVRERLDDPDRALLFHARFTMADRQRIEEEALTRFGKESEATQRAGRVLIATQVVEQSLDLDFDVLVSDLAPLDLLIQRAGRLHRHARDADGNPLSGEEASDKRPFPRLYVLAPEWMDKPDSNWVRRLLPGTAAVYSNPVYLWRTAKALHEDGGIRLPERARALLEGVYDENNAPMPEGLEVAHYDYWAGEQVAQSTARFNALPLEQGYAESGALAGWDDEDVPTRQSDERTIPVVLMRRTAAGLEPQHAEHRHPWAMSTLNLRESQARRLPDMPSDLEKAAEALQEDRPQLRFKRLWLPEEQTDSATTYDPELGAVIPRGGGEQ